MQRLDTFATPIWIDEFADLENQLDGWLQRIRELRQQSAADWPGRSARGGWRSEPSLLDMPEFAPLRQRILIAVKANLADYGAKPGSMVLNCHGWANVHDRGSHNITHVHEGCLLSGTVYLAVPQGAGDIVFTDPRPAALMECFARTDDDKAGGAWRHKSFSFAPRKLQMVMFPSWLSHRVEPSDCDERISIAFNIQQALMQA